MAGRIGLMLAASAAVLPVALGATAAPAELRAVPVVAGLHEPVAVAAPPGERTRLYIAEQGGLIRVSERGRLLPRPFLDLRALVWDKNLAGLLSVAFDPRFAQTHLVVVDYVGRDEEVHVVEYRASRAAARLASGRELLRVPIPRPVDPSSHFGGGLAFGPGGLHVHPCGVVSSSRTSAAAASSPSEPAGAIMREGLRPPFRASSPRSPF